MRPTAARRVSLLAGAALTLCAGVTVWRAAQLGRGGDALTARSERRFYSWAWRDPKLAAALGDAARDLRYGETVCLVDLAAPQDLSWLRVVATYELPHQIVIVPGERAKSSDIPACARTVLRRGPGGSLAVERAPRAADR